MKKKVLVVSGMMLSLFMIAPVMKSEVVDNVLGVETVYASESTFSEFWFQDTDGSWKVRDNSGNVVKNCWLCDDAVSSNGQNIWYLIDSNGNMVSAGLVKDSAGNYYSIETNHNGFYGMMRYQSGSYDGITLSLDGSHNGRFGAVLNQDGINALQSKYGVTDISNISTACVYTSSFRSHSSSSSTTSNSPTTSSQSTQTPQNNNDDSSVILMTDLGGTVNDPSRGGTCWNSELQELAEEVGRHMAH